MKYVAFSVDFSGLIPTLSYSNLLRFGWCPVGDEVLEAVLQFCGSSCIIFHFCSPTGMSKKC